MTIAPFDDTGTLDASSALDRPAAPSMNRVQEGVIAAVLLLGAIAFGLLFGVETLNAQSRGRYVELANSGAVWTLAAFVAALVCSRRRWLATLAGVATLLSEVIGYYAIAIPSHGYTATSHEEVFWSVAALWIGPLAGAAAWYWRRGPGSAQLAAGLSLAGLFIGEGYYERHVVHHVQFGTTEIVGGLLFAALNLAAVRTTTQARLVAGVLGLGVALTTAVVYAHPLFF